MMAGHFLTGGNFVSCLLHLPTKTTQKASHDVQKSRRISRRANCVQENIKPLLDFVDG
jgi:hypothetical protein